MMMQMMHAQGGGHTMQSGADRRYTLPITFVDDSRYAATGHRMQQQYPPLKGHPQQHVWNDGDAPPVPPRGKLALTETPWHDDEQKPAPVALATPPGVDVADG